MSCKYNHQAISNKIKAEFGVPAMVGQDTLAMATTPAPTVPTGRHDAFGGRYDVPLEHSLYHGIIQNINSPSMRSFVDHLTFIYEPVGNNKERQTPEETARMIIADMLRPGGSFTTRVLQNIVSQYEYPNGKKPFLETSASKAFEHYLSYDDWRIHLSLGSFEIDEETEKLLSNVSQKWNGYIGLAALAAMGAAGHEARHGQLSSPESVFAAFGYAALGMQKAIEEAAAKNGYSEEIQKKMRMALGCPKATDFVVGSKNYNDLLEREKRNETLGITEYPDGLPVAIAPYITHMSNLIEDVRINSATLPNLTDEENNAFKLAVACTYMYAGAGERKAAQKLAALIKEAVDSGKATVMDTPDSPGVRGGYIIDAIFDYNVMKRGRKAFAYLSDEDYKWFMLEIAPVIENTRRRWEHGAIGLESALRILDKMYQKGYIPDIDIKYNEINLGKLKITAPPMGAGGGGKPPAEVYGENRPNSDTTNRYKINKINGEIEIGGELPDEGQQSHGEYGGTEINDMSDLKIKRSQEDKDQKDQIPDAKRQQNIGGDGQSKPKKDDDNQGGGSGQTSYEEKKVSDKNGEKSNDQNGQDEQPSGQSGQDGKDGQQSDQDGQQNGKAGSDSQQKSSSAGRDNGYTNKDSKEGQLQNNTAPNEQSIGNGSGISKEYAAGGEGTALSDIIDDCTKTMGRAYNNRFNKAIAEGGAEIEKDVKNGRPIQLFDERGKPFFVKLGNSVKENSDGVTKSIVSKYGKEMVSTASAMEDVMKIMSDVANDSRLRNQIKGVVTGSALIKGTLRSDADMRGGRKRRVEGIISSVNASILVDNSGSMSGEIGNGVVQAAVASIVAPLMTTRNRTRSLGRFNSHVNVLGFESSSHLIATENWLSKFVKRASINEEVMTGAVKALGGIEASGCTDPSQALTYANIAASSIAKESKSGGVTNNLNVILTDGDWNQGAEESAVQVRKALENGHSILLISFGRPSIGNEMDREISKMKNLPGTLSWYSIDKINQLPTIVLKHLYDSAEKEVQDLPPAIARTYLHRLNNIRPKMEKFAGGKLTPIKQIGGGKR